MGPPPPPQIPGQYGADGGMQGFLNKMFMGGGDKATMQRNMQMAAMGMLGAGSPQGGRVPGFGEAFGKGMLNMQMNAQDLEQEAYRNSLFKERAEREKERLELVKEEQKRADEWRKQQADRDQKDRELRTQQWIASRQQETAHAQTASAERTAGREAAGTGDYRYLEGLQKRASEGDEVATSTLDYIKSLRVNDPWGGIYGGPEANTPPPTDPYAVVDDSYNGAPGNTPPPQAAPEMMAPMLAGQMGPAGPGQIPPPVPMSQSGMPNPGFGGMPPQMTMPGQMGPQAQPRGIPGHEARPWFSGVPSWMKDFLNKPIPYGQ